MRHCLVLLSTFLVLWSGGCAETSVCPPEHRLLDGVCVPEPRSCDTETITRSIPVGCLLDPDVAPAGMLYASWELTIEPGVIESGEEFAPIVRGNMTFSASDINAALNLFQVFSVEFTRIEIVNAKGRIKVRGADVGQGGEVILDVDAPKSCTYDEDGKRGLGAGPFPSCITDEDCTAPPTPLGPSNRCARFVDFLTESDCDSCADLGFPNLCVDPGFCAVGGVELAVGSDSGIYRAEDSGSVFFGWAEIDDVITSGVDRGAFDLSEVRRPFEGEIQHSGLDLRFGDGGPGAFAVAFECVMGVVSRTPDGPPTTRALLSRAPDGALISCPIQGR